MNWIKMYDLRSEAEHIAQVQEATLTTKDYGLEQTHGLFGSTEWWKHIEDGTLPLQTLKGEITRTWMGSMGDWPMFEMRNDDGSLHEFTREQPRDGSLDHKYAVGRPVEIDFVWQCFKKEAPDYGMPKEHKVVVAIRVGDQ
jgi:hypothetical protein